MRACFLSAPRNHQAVCASAKKTVAYGLACDEQMAGTPPRRGMCLYRERTAWEYAELKRRRCVSAQVGPDDHQG